MCTCLRGIGAVSLMSLHIPQATEMSLTGTTLVFMCIRLHICDMHDNATCTCTWLCLFPSILKCLRLF